MSGAYHDIMKVFVEAATEAYEQAGMPDPPNEMVARLAFEGWSEWFAKMTIHQSKKSEEKPKLKIDWRKLLP